MALSSLLSILGADRVEMTSDLSQYLLTAFASFVPTLVLTLLLLNAVSRRAGASGKKRPDSAFGDAIRKPPRATKAFGGAAGAGRRSAPEAVKVDRRAAAAAQGGGWLSSCCLGRPEEAEDDLVTLSGESADSCDGKAAGLYSEEDVLAAGVPAEFVQNVLRLAAGAGVRSAEPLGDPTTLWRFSSAREHDAEAALLMYRETVQWRAKLPLGAVMRTHGGGEVYGADGSRSGEDPFSWNWRRGTATPEAEFVQKYGYWGRLAIKSPADGAPIAIWRVGAADLGGFLREDVLDVLQPGFIAHLEDMLQCGRAISRREGRVVRARLIVDAGGVSLGVLRHAGKIKPLLALGKQFFPEITASVTIIRAPRVFSTIYNAVSPFLTPVMRRKVCILGDNFDEGLRNHAGLERSCLPRYLGGQSPDAEVAEAGRLPPGCGARLRASMAKC